MSINGRAHRGACGARRERQAVSGPTVSKLLAIALPGRAGSRRRGLRRGMSTGEAVVLRWLERAG